MKSPDIMSKKRNERWAWLWLSYSGFLFINPILEPSRFQWLGTLTVFAIFIGIFKVYISDRTENRPIRYWLIAAIFLLGLATFPWNAGGSTFFVYAAAFLPFVIESAAKILSLFVVESLFIVAEGFLFNTRGHLLYIGWPNVFVAIFLLILIGAGNIFFAEQKRADCKLRLAQEENVALAAVAERERIARDLHDVLGHTLSVIVLKAELAGRIIERDPQRAAQEIADVERTARTALSEVREAIGGYRSQGLTAEMEQARKTLQSADVALSCESPIPQLKAAEETVLCLAVREAVTNIVRHAQATHCRMAFTTSDDGFYTLLITDDGGRANLQEGNGLRGMRERVQSLGGRLSITADPGVTLRIELPPSTTPRPVEGPLVTL
ncbi:sensor histidine kinase [Tunturiibacter gelidoferens]|jgi:two-component system, NarL family, sensor histidine kinase DesK|uniref:Two-component system sensor histidine kinase DesK n=1 Tax=Tunturiibacter gelidiferens TaxID=3069689 RepID=A0A9X0QB70_9BACT|nr:sensor histidine kinase [Edaphobacter lichenicola]MBB5327152.1 two-component system sensor histidine kinase DesK [Edaphobacter lichenicola]